jgi:hypothetical protein
MGEGLTNTLVGKLQVKDSRIKVRHLVNVETADTDMRKIRRIGSVHKVLKVE